VDGCADPVLSPCAAPCSHPHPPITAPPATAAVWQAVADALDRARVLGPGWDYFFDTARRVAAAGVPALASSRAVARMVLPLHAHGGAPSLEQFAGFPAQDTRSVHLRLSGARKTRANYIGGRTIQ
jgi:hypothetical protein